MRPCIYLASASPRRHELLNQIGIEHLVLDVPPLEGADEPQLPKESPAAYVLRTAHDKAQRALQWIQHQRMQNFPILTADTTVILDETILHKPLDRADATHMLAQLSGRTHEVRTAIVLADQSRILDDVAITSVTFKTLSTAEIERYCLSQEPMGKAGAYGIQGYAGTFVTRIEGTFSGVMGLPVYETMRLLDTFNTSAHRKRLANPTGISRCSK